MRKLKSYDDFFSALRHVVRKHHYEFQLFDDVIYWQSPVTSLWTPETVVANVLYLPSTAAWHPHTMTKELTGMPVSAQTRLRNAVFKKRGHSKSLRRRLLRATELEGRNVRRKRPKDRR